jgi:hypothetical protein
MSIRGSRHRLIDGRDEVGQEVEAMTRLISVLLFVGATVGVSGQEGQAVAQSAESPTPNTIRLKAGMSRPKATLDAVAWMAGGTWRGEGLGGVTEETWSTPAAGAMMGMFRVVKRGANGQEELGFYEFLRLAKVTPEAIYFDGLTFRREGADKMTIFLALRDSAGTLREEVFRYSR